MIFDEIFNTAEEAAWAARDADDAAWDRAQIEWDIRNDPDEVMEQ